jgi:putative phage-type endonuclease
MITKICTSDMTHEAWLAKRRESIGGSDAGAILGLNKYTSPYALWAEKTGKIIPEDISDKEAVRLGHDLEDYVAKRFAEATGKKVRRENHFIFNDLYPFAHALPDRMIVGESAGLECKTTSSWEIVQQCRAGKYPDTWYAQVMHYMMVTGAERWYLAVLCFGHGFYYFTIERDEDEIRALADAERDFWQHVQDRQPVAVDGSEATAEAIHTIWADSSDGTSVDLSGVSSALQEYSYWKDRADEAKQRQNEAAAQIQSYMMDAERGTCEGYRVSWKTQERATFDRKRYEAVNGTIPPEYFKKSSSRPFKVTTV